MVINMKTRYLSLFLKLFLLLFIASTGCTGEDGADDVVSENDTDNKNKKPPAFSISGGWIAASENKPLHFCDMYLAADAFIFGSIVSVEMTENPFVAMDPETGEPDNTLPAPSIDECFILVPVLKITIKTSEFLTSYQEIERQEYVQLYIGRERMGYMNPFPASDISWSIYNAESRKRMKTSQVFWENDNCDAGGPCPLEAGQEIGFFARYNEPQDFWYMSELIFWANSTDLGSLMPFLYKEIRDKKSLIEIEDATKECKDFISQYADAFRSESIRNREISLTLPQCSLD